ncbi:putative hotdog family 3-hydroxylacyl-ACP dehydratase [Chitinivorax tropicus]|uniref:Putative hotdog family 3-hydroxylacyl-ACP dehydratase n=1 Tax=Chitinivorax tropicus TaxID=714531 RepID=A0A840ML46_9PROT|nr:hotdog family protein [Chitinivorax tropicus]MBB5017432.1 putative hotdog family 3-hydroxylacyl-ACP dehydratase [Chitinivorax tropicus]
MSDFPPIHELVPHGGRMVLLDRVIAADADSLTAEVTIHFDSMFCDGQQMGAWVGIEYMAQAIAAFAGLHARQQGEKIKVGFLLGTRRYSASQPYFAVGDTLRVTVNKELQGDSGLASFDCAIKSDNIDVRAVLTVFQPADPQMYLEGQEA